jgi:thiol:disulfide interchange protein
MTTSPIEAWTASSASAAKQRGRITSHSLILLLLCALCVSVRAQAPSPVKVSLIPEVAAAAPGADFRIAVKVEHAPTYHTYGKTLPAGDDTGLPTELIWELPAGWKFETLEWPAVHETPSTDGKVTQGYDGVIHLPTLLIPPADAQPGSTATLKVNYKALVCDPKSCRPLRQTLTLDIPIAAEAKPDDAAKEAFTIPAKAPAANDKPASVKKNSSGAGSLALNLLYAFIGGLILNIMPCVFPVLGVKIVGVVQQAGEDRAQVVKHGLAYTAGVIISFWIVAGVILAIGGGWAEQFRHPALVFGMSVFFLVFGLNMFGVFEIGASAVGVGSGLTAKSGYGGSFFSGLLATVVSTPCSAPFLGTALAYALGLPALPSLAFFTVIGLGLAAPYLFLSCFPNLAKALPRPGAWMESFKQFMSFLLFGTVAYFVWTLAAQLPGEKLLEALLALVLVGLACWIYGRWSAPHLKSSTRMKAYAWMVVVLGAGLWLWLKPPDDLKWEPWSPELVTKTHEELKKPVYIDFTARWCATCQVNKRVYKYQEVKDLIRAKGIVLLKADWTNPDERIEKALADLEKAAVPVNVLYIPGEKAPHILPENLTLENMKAAFSKLP